MNLAPTIEIPLSAQAVALIERYQAMPLTINRAVARGLDAAMQGVIEKITDERLTGQGPFPVEDHKLGVKTAQLRQSVWSPKATISGNQVSTSVGSPVFYARIHEFGLDYSRTSKPGKVRLRETKSGALVRQPQHPRLAVFAKKTHKLAREVSYPGGRTYEVHVPARAPFGFGLADSVPIITRKVSESVIEALDPKGSES